MTNPTDLPLFAEPAGEEVQKIHQDMENRNRQWIAKARRALASLYTQVGRPLSTDDLWEMLDAGEVEAIPEDASPNLLGSVFSGSDAWEAVGWTRSERDGSHGNLLRTWKLKGTD